MKVVFLSTSGNLGGAERALLTAITSVRRADCSLIAHLIAPADGALVDEARKRDIEAEVIAMPQCIARLGESAARGPAKALSIAARAFIAAPPAISYARRLRRRIDEINPDLVHCVGIKAHLLASRLSDRPVVWHVQDFLSARRMLAGPLRMAARRAAAAVAASRAVAEDFREVAPELPVHVIPNAIDERFLSPTPATLMDLDRAAGLAPLAAGGVRVGLVATYARWKGHAVFLRAAAMLRDQHNLPSVRFYIVGGPIYQTHGSQFSEAELRTMANELGIAADVAFVPFCADTRPVYAALDVCVHASVQPEPFGLTIAEAMACGRTVISTDGRDIFEQDREGIRIERGNPSALAAAIGRLIRDPAERSRLGAAAQRAARERHGPQPMGIALCTLYRAIMAGNVRNEPVEPLALEITTAGGR